MQRRLLLTDVRHDHVFVVLLCSADKHAVFLVKVRLISINSELQSCQFLIKSISLSCCIFAPGVISIGTC